MSNHAAMAEHNAPGQKTLKSYIVGFVLSLLLTVTAFALVQQHLLSTEYLYIALAGLAIVQLFVQATCFLRLNASPEGRWNLMPFLFTVLVIAILVSGSLWIMYNLNYNMVN